MKFKTKDGTILEGELVEGLKPTRSDKVATADYEFMGNWEEKVKEVLVTDKPEKKIFVNKKFASGSKFGNDCIFIRCIFGSESKFSFGCEFGSCCEFGSGCKFDANCEFGSWCEFGSKCEFDHYCEFGSKCKFSSGCEFGSGCEFSSGCWFGPECEFGSGCKIDKPYWDEKGKHE